MPTPFIPPSKSWQEMTRREIISSLIVVTVVGGVSVSIGIWGLVKDLILVPIVFSFFLCWLSAKVMCKPSESLNVGSGNEI